jgi:pyroglutamyl-peptidase
MNRPLKRVLVTGFEPFDRFQTNPSEQLLAYLKNHSFDFEVHTHLLPVSFTKAMPHLDEAIKKIQPTHVLLTGYADKREVLTVEESGLNLIDAPIPDNDGNKILNKPILENGPEKLFSTLPVDQLVQKAIEVNVPCTLSQSAGEYVCNHVLYSYLATYQTIPGAFIHIPKADNHEPFYEGIKAMIVAL